MTLNKIETKHDVFIKITEDTDFDELKDIINKIKKEDYDQIYIEGNYEDYEGCDSFNLVGTKEETDEEYNTRLKNLEEIKKKKELEKLERKKNEKQNRLKKLLEDKIKIEKMIQAIQEENKNN